MTTREKAIVSAYSGYLMCDMSEMLKYMSEKLGWTISEQELLSRHSDFKFNDELAQKILPDFMMLCNTMTTREKAIVSAWTKISMGDMDDMLQYLSEKFGKTITKLDLDKIMSYGVLRQKYDAAVLPDWLSLCEGDAESTTKASWWN